MSDPPRTANDAAADLLARAAVSAGKDAASRAARDLLGDEKKDAAAAKSRRIKLVAGAVLTLFLLLGLVGLVLNYWAWFLAAGVLGLGGLFGFWWLRSRLAARRAAADAPARTSDAPAARVELAPPAAPAVDPTAARAEAAARARAAAEAQAAEEQAVEDELAAMKARLRK